MGEDLAREKRAVRAYVGDRGFFVEVGANKPTSELSQTWHLEQAGWTGILVEPVAQLFDLIRRERPNAIAVRAACTSPGKVGQLTLHIPVVEGVVRTELAGTETGVDEKVEARYDTQVVPALTLDRILEDAGGTRPDFVSIDVEGTELDVLLGFDLARWRPKLVLIEDKWVYFDKHRYMTAHGYRLAKRTGPNSWYVPAGAPSPHNTMPETLSRYWKLYYGIWPRKLRKALEMKSLRPLARL